MYNHQTLGQVFEVASVASSVATGPTSGPGAYLGPLGSIINAVFGGKSSAQKAKESRARRAGRAVAVINSMDSEIATLPVTMQDQLIDLIKGVAAGQSPTCPTGVGDWWKVCMDIMIDDFPRRIGEAFLRVPSSVMGKRRAVAALEQFQKYIKDNLYKMGGSKITTQNIFLSPASSSITPSSIFFPIKKATEFLFDITPPVASIISSVTGVDSQGVSPIPTITRSPNQPTGQPKLLSTLLPGNTFFSKENAPLLIGVTAVALAAIFSKKG